MQSDLKDKTSAVMSLENQVRVKWSAMRKCVYSKYAFENISDSGRNHDQRCRGDENFVPFVRFQNGRCHFRDTYNFFQLSTNFSPLNFKKKENL